MTTFNNAFSRRSAMLAGLAALAGTSALAQPAAYPSRPIRLLVGYSAGGGVDAMARLLAPRLSTVLGQQVVVENRAGAAGLIAGDLAAKSAPDGYTLILAESAMLIAQYMQPHMTFDPVKSFTPVSAVFTLPLMIVTGNNFPARGPKEFLAKLKSSPGAYSFATSGVGTVQHLGFEMVKAWTGSFVVHIPYRGAAQIVPDVISGQVPIGVVSATAGMAQAKAGKLHAMALMSGTKLPGADEVPLLSEALPGFDAAPRLFILSPAGTPQPIVERLNEAIRTVMSAPDLAVAAAQQGAVPAYMGSAALASDIGKESARWGRIIREQKIKPE
ncbi:Bug family tripartite tricarboxylate transporter substrate binding protein [Variovorax terrae]|uniref:Tripartite tricarboxylate transporter substrate binding protein n=1 Tax=Variovorax terrae TaxID=2923278 RepID=A0A9X2ASB5_9BURK|nr:tripartite tricarboxylate transporter substrate-binding protein [Variovorax terrae]MCJ0765141.1 tripartite tricarboxylate transporter substrate binding protein [Variovorax terrae]